MNRLSRLIVLSAAVLSGCNLTYDREGLDFTPPASPEICADQGLAFCVLGTREFCADLETDELNCGACGAVCGIGVDCFAGIGCGPAAGGYCGAVAGEAVCGSTEHPVCVDTQTDANHCGFCGNDCGSQACIGGFCDIACGGSDPDKCSSATGPYCTDFDTDESNCGGCGVPCAGTCVAGFCEGGPVELAVEPRFPVNGAGWNAWVDGEWLTAFDSPCSPSSGLPCTHGGERRQVVVTGKTSCENLVAYDALGAFDWVCDPSVNPVRFVSTGLKPGKRLADLVDTLTPWWLANSVMVTDDMGLYGSSPAATWWSNPVEKVPSDGRLDVADTVYVADGSVGPPYVLDADRVALAVPGSVSVGTVVTALADVVSSTGRDFLWIEGDFDATGANHGVLLDGVGYSVVREASVTRPYDPAERYGLFLVNTFRSRMERVASSGSSAGVYLSGAAASDNRLLDLVLDTCPNNCLLIYGGQRNAVSWVQARGGLGFGVQLNNASQNVLTQIDVAGFYSGVLVAYGSSENTLVDVATAANRQHGLDVTSAGPSNRFAGLVATHNGGNGVYLTTANRTAFVDVVVANNAGNGVAIDASQDSVVAGLTAHHNGQDGLRLLNGSGGSLLSTLLLVGNGRGLAFTSASQNTVRDLAFSDHPGGGLVSDASSANYFTGLMAVAAGEVCDDGGTTTAGFSSDCQPMPPSDHTVTDGLASMEGSFAGPAPSDAVNTSPHSSGYLWVNDLDASGVDWTRFENPQRGWQRMDGRGALGCDGNPALRTSTACTSTWFGDARLFDWSLRASDLVVRSVLPYPGSGTWATHSWSDSTNATYLPRALERIGDAMGDEDGLCEPGEACLFTPNFGAYQGHDAMSGSTWIDSAEIFTYALNGR